MCRTTAVHVHTSVCACVCVYRRRQSAQRENTAVQTYRHRLPFQIHSVRISTRLATVRYLVAFLSTSCPVFKADVAAAAAASTATNQPFEQNTAAL
jgi:hypothetical protein